MTGLRRKIVSLACVLLLPACEALTGPSSYPDLRSVESPGDTSSALEERRQIVRDLIENRDLARYRQSVVRHRSGLEETPPPAAPAATALRAEDIIKQAPVKDDKKLDEAFVSEGEDESVYRDRTQFDDGTLNDFIRQLKRDTDPVVIEDPSAAEPSGDEPLAEEDSVQEETGDLEPQAWRRAPAPEPAIRLAFAPAVRHGGGPALLRLAADEGERGFFCSYLGWMVAWSTACLPDDVGDSDDDQVAGSPDVEDESGGDRNAPAAAPDRTAEPPEPQVSRRTEQARRSIDSPNEEGAASEDVDDNELLPVTSTLERLRNLIRSRGRPSDPSAEDETSLAYEADALRPRPEEGPPLPASRPEVETDLRIVRHDEVFEFNRTQRPAFKPAPPEPKTVIFPRAGQARPDAGRAAPEPTTTPPKEQRTATLDTDREVVDEDGPATRIPGALKDPDVLDSETISFEPGSVKLPKGVETRLEEMLDKARAMDAKLFIVSEAAVGRLAQDRARSVGLALVRLDATADLIEYDIVIDRSADRVQVLLKADSNADPSSAATGN